MTDAGLSARKPFQGRWRWLLLALLLPAQALAWAAPQPEVKLTMWSHHRHMANLLKYLVNEFNAGTGRKKGIQLYLRILGDDSSQIFQEAQKSGEGPDLYSSNFITGYPDPFKAGAQTWFDDLPGFREWKKQWPPWYWMEGVTTYRGRVIAIPAQVINSRLIYNKDLFRLIGRDPERPPASYAELRAVARQITAAGKGRIYGFAFCGGDSWWLEWMPGQWAEANGDRAYWDWQNGRWAIQGYGRVFQLLLDLEKDRSLFPGAAGLSNDALRAQFAEGRIGMFMGEAWDVGILNEQFPAKCDWGVASIPTYDGKFHGKPRAMMIGGHWSINGQSRHKYEAWEVVKWFNRYEIRAKFYERGACIDPDPSVGKYVKRMPASKGFRAFVDSLNQDYIATYPNLPGWKAPADNPFLVLRRLLTRGGDPRAELKKLDQTWNAALDRYFENHPDVRRGWNVYPEFDPWIGRLGPPLEKPVFKP
ncbi:multiple sugar transport system substrate-binding protein [Hydrogenispora ethanolica]|uniref:Multiple sugar transport system substrate-binding protein n=1 Tax=Hydrogenispora ethanolica TaxID=1082276 RepID=A0A4R1RU83_HYDET|nr:extracellular solute-binding protein [Hydrogenispora ethanolica]TCL70026.1 multiple sugar transport system substrate-binding protein [Hydrogenispora ethanolica]